MGKIKPLKIGEKEVASINVTYEELIMLYKQYIEKYGEIPTSDKSDSKHNLPCRSCINKILKTQNMTHDKFLFSLGYKNNKKKYNDLQVGDVVGRWKIIREGESRSSGKNKNIPYWICVCSCGSNIVKEVSENALKRKTSLSCGCVQQEAINKLKGTIRKQSFYDWCLDKNNDFLSRWDYSLNTINPKSISCRSQEKVFFKCAQGKHKSTPYKLTHVYNMKEIRCKYCDSFAQRLIDLRGENALELYWDYDKNVDDPWETPGSSHNKVWIKCIDTDYHGSYQISRDDVLHGNGCPYCSNRRIHPKDSFGQFLIDKYGGEALNKYWDFEKNKIDPFTIAPSTKKYKVWLKCAEVSYHPSSHVYPNDVKNHIGHCKYCAKKIICKQDSVGYLYPKARMVWSDKNIKSSFNYSPMSNKKVWWKCKNNKHDDFLRPICDCNIGEFGCPECSSEKTTSNLQNKVSEYITSTYGYTVKHEHNCSLRPKNPATNHFLPYDNEVRDIKLIIEVHGQQHYDVTGLTLMTAKAYNISPKLVLAQQKTRDKFKEEYALLHGYHYIAIPYWSERNDSYKKIVDDKIKEITEKAI